MMSIAEIEECVDELGGQTGRLQLNQMVLFADEAGTPWPAPPGST